MKTVWNENARYTNVTGVKVKEHIQSVEIYGTFAIVTVAATETEGIITTETTFAARIPVLVINQ